MPTTPSFSPRFWQGAAIAGLVLAVTVLFPELISLTLIGFAGVVLAAALGGAADALSARSSWLGRGGALAIVLTLSSAVVAALIAWAAFVTAPRASELALEAPEAMNEAAAVLTDWGMRTPARWLQRPDRLGAEVWDHRTQVFGLFSSGMGALAGLMLSLFIGVYGALRPSVYVEGALRLAAPSRRPRLRALSEEIAETLRHWLVGRALSATIIGVGSGLALWAFGVPLAFSLGILAALLTFVPNVGPVLTAVPAALLALTVDARTAAGVLACYAVLQFVETYVLTPFIEKRAVSIPPAVLLFSQVLLWVPFGLLGVALAAPLVAVAMVLTRRLYVEEEVEREYVRDPGHRPLEPRERPAQASATTLA